MKRKSILPILLLILVNVINLFSQDIHFSEPQSFPIHLNPALVAARNTAKRIAISYRQQWAGILGKQAYKTYSISYDQNLEIGRTDFLGFGAYHWQDKAGEAIFQQNKSGLAFAYQKKVVGTRNESHFFSMGFQGGFYRYQFDKLSATWSNQFNPLTLGFDSSIGSLEMMPDQSMTLDIGTGILWTSHFGKELSFFAGGTADHLTENSNNTLLGRKYSFQLGGIFSNSQASISIKPILYGFFQQGNKEVLSGTSVVFKFHKQESNQIIQIGGWARFSNRMENNWHMDAIITGFQYQIDRLWVSLSYDWTLTNLAYNNPGTGALELSLQYRIPPKENKKYTLSCPVF